MLTVYATSGLPDALWQRSATPAKLDTLERQNVANEDRQLLLDPARPSTLPADFIFASLRHFYIRKRICSPKLSFGLGQEGILSSLAPQDGFAHLPRFVGTPSGLVYRWARTARSTPSTGCPFPKLPLTSTTCGWCVQVAATLGGGLASSALSFALGSVTWTGVDPGSLKRKMRLVSWASIGLFALALAASLLAASLPIARLARSSFHSIFPASHRTTLGDEAEEWVEVAGALGLFATAGLLLALAVLASSIKAAITRSLALAFTPPPSPAPRPPSSDQEPYSDTLTI